MKNAAEHVHKRDPQTHQRTAKPNKKDLNPPRADAEQYARPEPRTGLRSGREKKAPEFISRPR
jgi:hypothetical protein